MSRPAADRLRPLRRTRQVREFTTQPVDRGRPRRDRRRRPLVGEQPQHPAVAVHRPHRWRGDPRASPRSACRRPARSTPRRPRSRSSCRSTTLARSGIAYDDGRAAERILIAAGILELGAGIAWVRSDVRAPIGEVLGLPADRYVRTIVALGHPTEAALEPKTAPGEARLPRDETVFRERWPGG